MEPFILYGLVILFFLLLALFVVRVLSSRPYREPAHNLEAQGDGGSNTKIAYGVLSTLLIFFVVITFLHSRQAERVSPSQT
jgi:hypothetical protein